MQLASHFEGVSLFLFKNSKNSCKPNVHTYIFSHTFPENFDPRLSPVTRSGQVAQLQKHLELRRDYCFQRTNKRHSGSDKGTSTYKSHYFGFGTLKSRQFCGIAIMRQWKIFKFIPFISRVQVGAYQSYLRTHIPGHSR